MAFLQTEEDQKLQQAGQMGAGGGAPAGGVAAPRQSRSGGWVNLQKYLGGGDQTSGKITGAIEQEKGALGQEVAGTEQKAQQLGGMLANPNAYTAQQFQQASTFAPQQDFSAKAGALGQKIGGLGTEAGRFDALKNAQQATATGGQSRLNQYLMSHGTGGANIQSYAQQNANAPTELQNKYGAATQGIQSGTQALRDSLTGEQGKYNQAKTNYDKVMGYFPGATNEQTARDAINREISRYQELIAQKPNDPLTDQRRANLAQRQQFLNDLNSYSNFDKSRMTALQKLMGA